ncbi:UTRA domain-containing protein [Herbidospora sp. NEAU-GS84]|uniref:UTRA domain-containing protein n=1 Tax=Herbidospora solisilvae TaxID=2696284 RepID=A0A7C9P0I1_9ACTN|nr:MULTISPECIES: GntR family transcriptional regulator [Herbidospora]NAS23237.1 UTRA domain-containing protein [Herbidospora solisilvae]GLX92173.1 GntR family transcriptional regulator [Herbidospora sp. NBRC 101105]
MANSDPVYLRVVEDLRRQITEGLLQPGAPIPSRHQITRKYGVGETAARHALRVLAQEGLIIGRVGSGHRVRQRPDLLPLHRAQAHFSTDMHAVGRRPTCDVKTDSAEARPDIAVRLRIAAQSPVTRTRIVYRSDGKPVQLAVSYEPIVYNDGTDDITQVAHRLGGNGLKLTEVTEHVYARVPQPVESDVLDLPAGVHVLHVERTHWAGDKPVETSDVIIPCDQFRLVYTLPAPYGEQTNR